MLDDTSEYLDVEMPLDLSLVEVQRLSLRQYTAHTTTDWAATVDRYIRMLAEAYVL